MTFLPSRRRRARTLDRGVPREEFHAAVMAQMAEGVYALDAEGRLMFMNRAASKMLGWTEDELRGKQAHEAFHHRRADGTPFTEDECRLVRVRQQGQAVRVEDDVFVRRDGTHLPVAYSAAPFLGGNDGDEGCGVVVVFRDATEKDGERARVQRELAGLAWVGRIVDALDEERLVLHAQRIVPLNGGEEHEELLVRMLDRDGELILPGSFLPTAEKYGLIADIDRWVVAQAVRLAADGRRVQANLSSHSIAHHDMLSVIDLELQAAEADPSHLALEMTETALMEDVDAGVVFASGLVDLGCGVALDDFGTGFSSFTHLQRLPVTQLKIDRAFVRDLPTREVNRHLVEGIVGLAQSFGSKTVAEGVEDERTLDLLRGLGVDYAQGLFVGAPVPATAA